jgi:hypothetical protein
MYSKYWQIVRDDSTRTFEVCGQDSNTNFFTNGIHGMQKAGMTVSGMTPPVAGKYSNKDAIKIIGYTKEQGLYQRLLKEHRELSRKLFDLGEE